MKTLLTILFLFLIIPGCVKREEVILPATAFVNVHTLELTGDTTISTVWDGGGKVYRPVDAQGNVHILHGNGIFQNWIIDAPLTSQIFDSSINLKNIQVYGDRFSTAWYGAKTTNADNWWNLQKSINVCHDNYLACFTPGKLTYRYSKTLDFSTKVNGTYQQYYIHFFGDATYWNNNNGTGTNFQYTGTTGPAMNYQLQKGTLLDHFAVNGLYKCPALPDSLFFKLTEATFTDVSGNNLPDSYTGIAFDYYYDGHSRSGSTGIQMNNVSIGGFARGLAFSYNGYTQNDEAHVIDMLHFYANKWDITTGQPQEKGTSINHIYTWDRCYNVFKNMGAGNYSLDVANIAANCIEPVQARIGQWFSSSISNWFCERIGRVCTISANQPFTFRDCNFDLVFGAGISKNRDVVISNSNFTSFTGCTIRYYDGSPGTIYVHSTATFSNCSFYLDVQVNHKTVHVSQKMTQEDAIKNNFLKFR